MLFIKQNINYKHIDKKKRAAMTFETIRKYFKGCALTFRREQKFLIGLGFKYGANGITYMTRMEIHTPKNTKVNQLFSH